MGVIMQYGKTYDTQLCCTTDITNYIVNQPREIQCKMTINEPEKSNCCCIQGRMKLFLVGFTDVKTLYNNTKKNFYCIFFKAFYSQILAIFMQFV